MTGPGNPPGPATGSFPTLLPVQIAHWDGARGVIDGGGRTFPFTRSEAVGFHPAAGLSAVAELGADGSLVRLTLPGHPVRAEAPPARPFGWNVACNSGSIAAPYSGRIFRDTKSAISA